MIVQFIELEGKKPYFLLYYLNPDKSKHTERTCNFKVVCPEENRGTYWDCDREIAFEEPDIWVPDLMLISEEFLSTL